MQSIFALALLAVSAIAVPSPRDTAATPAVTCANFQKGTPGTITNGIKLSGYKTVVAFGDGYAYNGRDNGTAGSPAVMTSSSKSPYAGGRWSNGPVFVEDLASSMGAQVKGFADITGGYPTSATYNDVNRDFGSAMSDYSATVWPLPVVNTLHVISVASQNADDLEAIEWWIATVAANTPGATDFLIVDNSYLPNYTTAAAQAVRKLYLQAFEPGSSTFAWINTKRVAYVDLGPLYAQIRAKPSSFSMTSTGACLKSNTTTVGECSAPGTTLEWIPGYPSAATHKLIAQYIQQSIASCQ